MKSWVRTLPCGLGIVRHVEAPCTTGSRGFASHMDAKDQYCQPRSITETRSWTARAPCGSPAGDHPYRRRGGGGTLSRTEPDHGRAAKQAGALDPIDRSSACYPGNWRALCRGYIQRSKVVLWQVDGEPMADWSVAARDVPKSMDGTPANGSPWSRLASCKLVNSRASVGSRFQ